MIVYVSFLWTDLFIFYYYYQDKETGFHRGFCWVGYSSEEGLQNALQKDTHIMEGSRVRILRMNYKPVAVNANIHIRAEKYIHLQVEFFLNKYMILT